MNRALTIAIQEYRKNVFKRSFILVILSVPAFIIFSIGLGIFIESIQENSDPVGYVDHARVILASGSAPEFITSLIDEEIEIDFLPYLNEETAQEAVESGAIQGFFVLPETYPETLGVELVFIEEPGSNVRREFESFLRVNLLGEQDPNTAIRAASGSDITVRSLDGKRIIPGTGSPLGSLIPLFICMAFLFLIMMSSGYMMGAITEEKENRTIEILTTSVSSSNLILGKVLGTVGIGLTIFMTWTVAVIIGLLIASQFEVSWLENLIIDWRVILATTSVAIPAFLLVAAIMTGIGAMVTTTQEGQSVSAIFFVLHFAPFYVAWAFVTDPHSPLAVALSLMPFTALLTLGMRNLFTIVPAWQVYASVAIQTILAIGAIWLAARAFRMGMLQYGQRLPWERLLRFAR